MNPLFEFSLDKEANFAYWTQLLLGQWSWYFEKEKSNLFIKESSRFSSEEQDALNKLKEILQKKGNQYRWLWQRYDGHPISNVEEKETYAFIRSSLNRKFESLWDKEVLSLGKWAAELGEYNFQKIIPVFQKIASFLGISSGTDLVFHTRAKLLISDDFPTGATRPDFKDLIILNVSRVSVAKINRIVGVAAHEFMHLLNNQFGLITHIVDGIDLPTIRQKDGYNWKYLITETILTSITSKRSNTYLGMLLDFNEEEVINDKNLSHKLPLNAYSYEFLIRIAAFRILNKTTHYIDTKKTIDISYINYVIKVLAVLFEEREHNV